MPALNHTAFPKKVESGEKLCSIRARRKRPIRAGETIYHYTGMRHKGCRLLRTAACTQVRTIIIEWSDRCGNYRILRVVLDGQSLSLFEIQHLARKDGFDTVRDFQNYFLPEGRDVFEGDLIEWL